MMFIQVTLSWLCDAPIMVRKCWKPRKAHMYLREDNVFLKKRRRKKKKIDKLISCTYQGGTSSIL